MKVFNISDMKGGWYIGDFEPVAYKTKDFEVSYKLHPKGEEWDTHYHKESDEINFLVSGKMIIQDRELNSGEIFIIPKYEIADPKFLEDCYVVCVKTKSSINDKHILPKEIL